MVLQMKRTEAWGERRCMREGNWALQAESSLAPFAQNLEEAELTHADIALQWNPDHHEVKAKPGKSQSQVSVHGWG